MFKGGSLFEGHRDFIKQNFGLPREVDSLAGFLLVNPPHTRAHTHTHIHTRTHTHGPRKLSADPEIFLARPGGEQLGKKGG